MPWRKLALLGMLWGTMAEAAPPANRDKAAARTAFERAMRDYNLGDFADALGAFKEAYRLYPDAAILLDIGQCQRQLGDKQSAARSYRAYLRESPNAANVIEVRALIDDLEAALRRDEEVKLKPPQDPVRPGEVEPKAPAPPVVTVSAPPPVIAAPVVLAPPAKRRWWVVGVVGGVAVAIGLGVGLGVGLAPHAPEVTIGTVRGN